MQDNSLAPIPGGSASRATETLPGDDFSLFSLGTILLRNRWRIARWSLAIGILAALSVAWKPRAYQSMASFIPQGTDAGRSQLATLAGQFGVAIPSSGQGLTPEFYASLVKKPVVLRHIALDTFVVAEQRGRSMRFLELFNVQGSSETARIEEAVRLLESTIQVSHNKPTGVIELTAITPWPSVSRAVVASALDGVNAFNLASRQSQAAEERRFVESRLQIASQDLREAEERLARFLVANRQFESSPELRFQNERLTREVTMKQGVFTSLNQAHEEVRLREVRNTPVITVVEPPMLPTRAEPRGRVVRTVLGLVFGSVIGAILSLITAIVERRRRRGDAEVDEFVQLLTELRSRTMGRVPWIAGRRS